MLVSNPGPYFLNQSSDSDPSPVRPRPKTSPDWKWYYGKIWNS